MRIWKYELSITDSQAVKIPRGAAILDVQAQYDTVCLWVLCDEDAPVEPRHIAIYGTGNSMPDAVGRYISTFQMQGGDLVFHAFEVSKP